MSAKEGEEEARDFDKDRSSIFVRNICFDVDSRELEELCEEYGPVRRCILVHGKGEAQHRGYGFVQYALKEDAERAAKDLNGKQVRAPNVLVRWGAHTLQAAC
eukprot:scaffold5605_cov161-Prasinococcus_capsulatus_cf.AAC.1